MCWRDADTTVQQRVISGEVQFVLITPESIIQRGKYQDMLPFPNYGFNLVAVVVDEAHCVKTWGNDFLLAFSQIEVSYQRKLVSMLSQPQQSLKHTILLSDSQWTTQLESHCHHLETTFIHCQT